MKITEFIRGASESKWDKTEEAGNIIYTLELPYAVLTVKTQKIFLDDEQPSPKGLEFLDEYFKENEAYKRRRELPWVWSVAWNYEPNVPGKNLPLKSVDTQEDYDWMLSKGLFGNSKIGHTKTPEEGMKVAEGFYNSTVEEAQQQGRLMEAYQVGDQEAYQLTPVMSDPEERSEEATKDWKRHRDRDKEKHKRPFYENPSLNKSKGAPTHQFDPLSPMSPRKSGFDFTDENKRALTGEKEELFDDVMIIASDNVISEIEKRYYNDPEFADAVFKLSIGGGKASVPEVAEQFGITHDEAIAAVGLALGYDLYTTEGGTIVWLGTKQGVEKMAAENMHYEVNQDLSVNWDSTPMIPQVGSVWKVKKVEDWGVTMTDALDEEHEITVDYELLASHFTPVAPESMEQPTEDQSDVEEEFVEGEEIVEASLKKASEGDWFFLTTCVEKEEYGGSQGKDAAIEDMVDASEELTYEQFEREVGRETLRSIFTDYNWKEGDENGLEMKDDSTVSFYKSNYRGVPCRFVVHRGIEYVFVGEYDYNAFLSGEYDDTDDDTDAEVNRVFSSGKQANTDEKIEKEFVEDIEEDEKC